MLKNIGQAISWTSRARNRTTSGLKPDQYPPVGFNPGPGPGFNLTKQGHSPTT